MNGYMDGMQKAGAVAMVSIGDPGVKSVISPLFMVDLQVKLGVAYEVLDLPSVRKK